MSTIGQIQQLNGSLPGAVPWIGQLGSSQQYGQQSSIKTTGKLAEALAKAQKNFKTVLKDKTAKGEKFSYKYADLSSVLEMVVPCLAEQGIAFTQPLRREGDKTYVVTRIQLGDEFLEDAGLPIPSQVRPQELGTYLSYYRRYGVSTFLGIAADEDTDAVETRPDYKSESVSGQTLVQSAKAASNPTQDARQAAKRGRPANPAITKATEVVPPAPVENAGPQIATDEDIPAVIGNKPTKEEMTDIKTRLNSFGLNNEKLKTFVLKQTNREAAKDLTGQEWKEILAELDKLKAMGMMHELLG